MNSVQQKQLFLSPPHIGSEERDFVREAFESNYIAPLGPMVDAATPDPIVCSPPTTLTRPSDTLSRSRERGTFDIRY